MKTIRFRIIILASWLVLFCIIGTQLNSLTFGFQMVGIVLALLLAAVVIPQISKIPFRFIIILLTSLFLISQFLLSDRSGSPVIMLTFLNILSLFITAMLSRWLNLALTKYELTNTDTLPGESKNMSDSVNSGLGLIYREVRRARNHQRPLALLSIEVDKNSIDSSVNNTRHPKKMKDVYQDLSKMLIEQLEDCTIIVQNTDHFLAALPETTPQDLAFVLKRLHQNAGKQIGIDIKIGAATLPEDDYTFEGLFEKATQLMIKDKDAELKDSVDSYSVEQQITQ